ncbi:MAG: tRNA (adenine-N1)-methyltransferase [Chloroflexota bacterium]|nr:MAG: tRNA (adenine-N1)-methyltransferase [Chloroflexota bacterium]
MTNYQKTAKHGDIAQLVGLSHKNFILRLQEGQELQTHRGIVSHDELIGKPWGSKVFSHLGNPFFLLKPSLGDLISATRRTTQILYPKDIGFILVTLGIGPGQHIVEAGTGSGAMTTALAHAVGPDGHITTYEMREEMLNLAKKNLTNLGLQDRVTFKHADIKDGFDERDVYALFMDVPNPEDYLNHVREVLSPGGFFGCIIPTTNQLMNLIPALRQGNFAFIEICETFLRYYKPVSERLRPTDRMIAHTGYLVFARSIISAEDIELFEKK